MRTGTRLDRRGRKPRDHITRPGRGERQAGQQLAVAAVEPDLELPFGRRGRAQPYRVAIAADLEVEWELANRRGNLRDLRQLRTLVDPAGLHDVDQEHRARPGKRRVVLEIEHQLVRTGAQLLAPTKPGLWRLRRAEGRIRGVEAYRLVPAASTRQPTVEIRIVEPLGGRPTDLRHGGGARKRHPLQPILGADVLGPEVALQAENVTTLRGWKRRRHRVEAIHRFEIDDASAARWLAGAGALSVVEVQHGPRRKDRIVARGSRGECSVDPAPGHHRGIGCETAFEDLIPADQPPPVRGEKAPNALHEVALQRVLVRDSALAHPLLHLRRALPLILHGLVAADVDILARKELHHLAEDVLEEDEGRVLDVEQVWVDAPVRRDRG